MGTKHTGKRQLLADLASAGLEVEEVSDLFEGGFDYRSAIPVLIKWLPRISDPLLKEEIARALAVRWAKPSAADALLREFRVHWPEPMGTRLNWALANAIEVVATDKDFPAVRELVLRNELGVAREMLALALGKMRKTPEAEDLLIQLLDDSEIVGHALAGLRTFRGGRRAQQLVEKLSLHENAWIRKEAQQLLRALKE